MEDSLKEYSGLETTDLEALEEVIVSLRALIQSISVRIYDLAPDVFSVASAQLDKFDEYTAYREINEDELDRCWDESELGEIMGKYVESLAEENQCHMEIIAAVFVWALNNEAKNRNYFGVFDKAIKYVDNYLLDKPFVYDRNDILHYFPANDNETVCFNGVCDDIPDNLREVEFEITEKFTEVKPVMDEFKDVYFRVRYSYITGGDGKRNEIQFAQIFGGHKGISVLNVAGLDDAVLKIRFTNNYAISGKGDYRIFVYADTSDEVICFTPFKKTKKSQNVNTNPSDDKIRRWWEKFSK